MDADVLIAIPVGVVLFGGVAIAGGVTSAVGERRRWGSVWRSSVLGLLLFVLALGVVALGTVRGCGQDCVVDASPLVSIAFWNLAVWELVVLGVWNWTRPSGRESGSQEGRKTT